jgi:hypothetical protein
VKDCSPEESEVEALLRGAALETLPPRLAPGRLWREVEARRQPRSVAVLSPGVVDARALLRAALSPAGGR